MSREVKTCLTGRARRIEETDTVDQLRLKRDLNNKSGQRDLGNGQRRYIRDVNEKQQEWQEMNKP